jgi:hypothetical protein
MADDILLSGWFKHDETDLSPDRHSVLVEDHATGKKGWFFVPPIAPFPEAPAKEQFSAQILLELLSSEQCQTEIPTFHCASGGDRELIVKPRKSSGWNHKVTPDMTFGYHTKFYIVRSNSISVGKKTKKRKVETAAAADPEDSSSPQAKRAKLFERSDEHILHTQRSICQYIGISSSDLDKLIEEQVAIKTELKEERNKVRSECEAKYNEVDGKLETAKYHLRQLEVLKTYLAELLGNKFK